LLEEQAEKLSSIKIAVQILAVLAVLGVILSVILAACGVIL